MRRITMRDLATMSVVWLAGIAICLPLTWKHFYAQLVLGIPLARSVGFNESSPYTSDPDYRLMGREVVAVASVTKHSIAERAGLRPNDVFVDYCRKDRGATALFLDLERSRGHQFCTAVVSLFEPGALELRHRRRICFVVPKAAG